jgi:hypothetical protein
MVQDAGEPVEKRHFQLRVYAFLPLQRVRCPRYGHLESCRWSQPSVFSAMPISEHTVAPAKDELSLQRQIAEALEFLYDQG